MKLHFPISKIRKGLEELKTAKTTPVKYDWEERKQVPSELGFMLVGDQGVYLLPNTVDGKHNVSKGKDDSFFVIYAKECDPTKLDFDTWWENKRASFGGDDGAEFVAMTEIESMITANDNPKNLVVDMNENGFTIICV